METKTLLLFAEESSEKLKKLQDECETNNETVTVQIDVINEIIDSSKEVEKIPEKLRKLDSELALVDEQMDQAVSVLTQLLSEEKPKVKKDECSDLIKMIINTQKQNINDIVNDSLKVGNPYIPIVSVIEFENSLATLIQSMKDKGMFPIFDEKKDIERNEIIKAHNQKILNFMMLLQKSGYKM